MKNNSEERHELSKIHFEAISWIKINIQAYKRARISLDYSIQWWLENILLFIVHWYMIEMKKIVKYKIVIFPTFFLQILSFERSCSNLNPIIWCFHDAFQWKFNNNADSGNKFLPPIPVHRYASVISNKKQKIIIF